MRLRARYRWRMKVDEQIRLRDTLYCSVGRVISALGYFELNLFNSISRLKRDEELDQLDSGLGRPASASLQFRCVPR